MLHGDISLVQMTNEDAEFYCLIGPFLARRAIAKAYGDRLWDEDGDRWFVARTRLGGKVMGFVVLRAKPRSLAIQICNDYILPAYRQSDLQERLLRELLAQCPSGSTVQVTASQDEEELYSTLGFARQELKGRFFVMSRKMDEVVHEQ